ncbi:sigma-54 interaction domain-containing protein [Candidatus Deferrimicrobium sp.]|uniref:sigma-54 interaction domain-containing protein n=1 Tax=Candidatus Deferrimicrobium sp. TaxID=3060586 RepID=UPI002ED47DB5
MNSDDLLHGASSNGSLTGERMLAAILNSLSEAVITVGRDHRIASFNRAAERLVGIPEAEALGKDCREVLRASFGPAQHDCPMGEIGEGGKPRVDVEGTLVRADGRIVPVSASWAFFTGETGEVHGFVISFRSYEEIERIAEERKSKFPFRDIVGKTPRIRRIFDLIEVVKDTDSTVLITGESGTGKGLFARAIHDLSPRREKAFVKVNAAALTETLLESEMFGHVKGAFTGAVSDKVGRFEAADGGTIFLDEIGEISPALQVKLLRVLQDHEFERVGSSRTQRADVRVIAATNRELKEEMRAGRFREDLFYRLNVIPLVVPPLRERREDIPLLVDHILKSLRKRGLDRVRAVSPEAMRCLMKYPWPGNVRELENVLERGAVCSRGVVLGMEDIADEVREHGCIRQEETVAVPSVDHLATGEDAPGRSTADAPAGERDLLLRALEEHRWNRGTASAALGIDRSTLWRKMKRLGIA